MSGSTLQLPHARLRCWTPSPASPLPRVPFLCAMRNREPRLSRCTAFNSHQGGALVLVRFHSKRRSPGGARCSASPSPMSWTYCCPWWCRPCCICLPGGDPMPSSYAAGNNDAAISVRPAATSPTALLAANLRAQDRLYCRRRGFIYLFILTKLWLACWVSRGIDGRSRSCETLCRRSLSDATAAGINLPKRTFYRRKKIRL
jgi:hypothetical protein